MSFRLALVAGLLVATPALAQPPAPPGAERQVFISPAGEPFRAPFGEPYPVATWFKQADANSDGAISRDELIADSLAFFDKLDADKNGTLDGFEIADYERKVAPEISSRSALALLRAPKATHRPLGGRQRPYATRSDGSRERDPKQTYDQGRTGAGLFGLINEVQPVMGQDSDFNRRISRDEAIKAAKDRFAILDSDKDGKLVLATLPKPPMQRLIEDQAAE
ncbi:hypothetical protein GVN21_08280 [Caulobacter sp. SLTY]|uniref:EF-hand domain-containing protein n=1 Tax=Caulobacter sp. SLTY TaxID=2683262 RepID=UPI0014135458|nr:EF-hand domain-containing protein [Caulobacter sp. SLTY]NBB15351.1 hypothetical protein [Caulobacter sp. SLTY]